MEKQSPTVAVQMLIRRGISEVFNAFIDPAITKEFWFTKASGKLEENKEIRWTWEMYNVSCKVIAKEIIPNQRIKFNWFDDCLLYTSPSPRDATLSRMPSSA